MAESLLLTGSNPVSQSYSANLYTQVVGCSRENPGSYNARWYVSRARAYVPSAQRTRTRYADGHEVRRPNVSPCSTHPTSIPDTASNSRSPLD